MGIFDSFINFMRPFVTSQPLIGDGDDNTSGDKAPKGAHVDQEGWLDHPVVTRRAPLHPGRLGGAIDPWGAALHTTDMHPDTFEALITKSQRDAGAGSGWHFAVGRNAKQGVVQSASLRRNANHAGAGVNKETGRANPHGYVTYSSPTAAASYHPNKVLVGIEVHCAGLLTKIGGQWRVVSGGKASGAPIPEQDVQPISASRGWHKPTPWQIMITHELLDALGALLWARPPGELAHFGVKPNGTPPPWVAKARMSFKSESRVAPPVFGHVDLDPARKTDPGPAFVAELGARGW